MIAGMSKYYTVENHGLGVKNGVILKQTRLGSSVDGALEKIIVWLFIRGIHGNLFKLRISGFQALATPAA